MKNTYIFGAGNYGSIAYKELGGSSVFAGFIDNNKDKFGTVFHGVPVSSFEDFISENSKESSEILICVADYADIEKQITGAGVIKYDVWLPEYTNELHDIHNRIINSRILSKLQCENERLVFLEGIEPYRIIVQAELKKAFPYIGVTRDKRDADVYISVSPHFPEQKELDILSLYKGSMVINPYRKYWHINSESIINNPYKTAHDTTEDEFIENVSRNTTRIKRINDFAEKADVSKPLFKLIEIETINRCNGQCTFCPVNARVDSRKMMKMKEGLFKKIIDELAIMEYTGVVSTFSNNEPFLDDRIVYFNEYAREKLPYATLQIFTNGTMLTLDLFKEVIRLLDHLIIDNYSQELELIEPVRKISEYVKEHPELKRKVRIDIRKVDEILTTRGNNAQNRVRRESYGRERCATVYEQMVIRPDGKVSLCCNDPLGKYTLGDVNTEGVFEIWYGSKYSDVRQKLNSGRDKFGECEYCDVFNLFSIS